MTPEYLKQKENALKIQRSVSNIIWLDGYEDFHGLILLVSNSLYVSAIELSLFNIFGKSEIPEKDLLSLKQEILDEQVNISGIHNIFADIDKFQGSLFTSEKLRQKFLDRVKRYIDYSKLFGVSHLSLDYADFLRLDGVDREVADEVFISLLEQIDKFSGGEVEVHIVPTSSHIRDYLNNYVEAIELLKSAKHLKNIRVLVDLKEIFDTLSFDLKYFKDHHYYLTHFHVSNLDGGPVTFDDIPLHNKIVNVSYSKDYTNKFFVMKVKNLPDSEKEKLANYTQYIHVFKEIYQVPLELSPFCSRLFPNLVYRHISAEGPDIDHLLYNNRKR